MMPPMKVFLCSVNTVKGRGFDFKGRGFDWTLIITKKALQLITCNALMKNLSFLKKL